jgi:Uma2 family endonuclease
MALARPRPEPGFWTYEDLLALPDDGRRYEIIEGVLYEMPGPNARHAIALANLIELLIPIVRALGGRWLTAPLDLFVPGGDPIQPDLLVILPGGAGRWGAPFVALGGMHGAEHPIPGQ